MRAGSGISPRYAKKENMFDCVGRRDNLSFEGMRPSWAPPAGAVTPLPLQPLGCLLCVELNPSYFHKPKLASEMVFVALLGKSDVVN